MTPTQFFALNSEMTKLMVDTQTVMTLRLMGMAGALPAQADENDRMMAEKAPAFTQAMTDMTAAAMAGLRPDQVMSAGMVPLQTQVSENRDRLTK